MPIPSQAEARLPLLQLAAQGGELSNADSVEKMAAHFNVTAEERSEFVPSGSERRFDNVVRWAKAALRKAGLVDIPREGVVTITDRGQTLLQQSPPVLDNEFLKRFPEFAAWQNHRRTSRARDEDPEEAADASRFPLRFVLSRTMAEYLSAKTEPQKDHAFARWFRELAKSLPLVLPEVRDYEVNSSVGHSGNWTYVPWITIRRPDLSPSVQSGIYVAYLFRSDMQAVYLSLNQGVTDVGLAGKSKLENLRSRADTLRTIITPPEQVRCTTIDLQPGTSLGVNYEAAHIWGVEYSADALPDENHLRADLAAMLDTYSRLPADLLDRERFNQPPVSYLSSPADVAAAPEPEATPYTFQQLIEDTLWTEAALKNILKVMLPLDPDKPGRQIVLAGPPGTGKTWVARNLVKYATENDARRVRLVQFHPSYSYEQFIEGLMPVARDNAIAFEVVPGVVRQAAETCGLESTRYFIIIDEMNRANLSRVFGELMFLFEYRNETIQLPYSGQFSLPANLSFIGTMNTADRSIRSIDLALRRRFDVFDCMPDVDILAKYYAPEAARVNEVSDLLEGFLSLNHFLSTERDEYHAIGHTFFMEPFFGRDRLREVWDRQIAPIIAEYFFDDPVQRRAIKLERFWKSLASTSP